MLDKVHNKMSLRTWIEINQQNLEYNYHQFREYIDPSCQLMAVSKSNAYGHGLFDYSHAVDRLGIDWLAVDSIIEAIKLRQEGIEKPLLVLGHTLPDMLAQAVTDKISLTISNWEALKGISHDLIGLKIHLKFDTGMHRQGFMVQEAFAVLSFLQNNLPNVIIEGVYTHFASAKRPSSLDDTINQIAEFEKVRQIFLSQDLHPLFHASATSGIIVYPEAHFDLVRVGIGLYGLWPSLEVKQEYEGRLDLHPILEWKTVIGEIKTIPSGSLIGYDYTEQVDRDTKIAILPVGYWHGYDRELSSKGYVIIKDIRCKVLGRVSMDMIVVEITDVGEVAVGDEVILLGKGFDAYEMAELANTSWYETITRLNPLIKRFYV
jgi:alanine racemase